MNISLADDDPVSAILFKLTIEKFFPVVDLKTFQNGEDLLNSLTNNHIPDIIFLDLNMPVLNGFDFMEKLSMLDIIIPQIVIFSVLCKEEDKGRLFELGCSHFIEKPITREKLQSIIQIKSKSTLK